MRESVDWSGICALLGVIIGYLMCEFYHYVHK